MTTNESANPAGSQDESLAAVARLLASDPGQAAAEAEAILRLEPEHPVATLYLGIARRLLGKPADAMKLLEPLAQSRPDWAPAQYELGRACLTAGRSEAALAALRRAVELQPALPGAWCTLADALRAAGDVSGADTVCLNRIEHGSRDPRLQQASTALRENRVVDANNILRQALQVDPTDALAMQMLATVVMRHDHLDDAARLLTRCLQLAPNHASAHHDLALVHDRLTNRGVALRSIERARQLDPADPGFRHAHAVLLDRVGDYDQAIDLYAGLLADSPDRHELWMAYGHSLRAAGQREESMAAFEKAIALQPDAGEAWWSLADFKTSQFTDRQVDELRRRRAADGLSDHEHAYFEFTLGKALEDRGEFAASFEHYAEGNRLRRQDLPYDAAELTTGVQRSCAVFSSNFFEQRTNLGCAAPDPIFIVGLPRSGSTLVEQILASHPSVEGTMELPEMLAIVRALNERDSGQPGYPEVVGSLGADEIRTLGEGYLESTRTYRKTDRPFFTDKMPNNFANVGLIQLLLPNARIVDVRRHPVATCFSIFKQLFARGQPFAYDLEDLARAYRDYLALMAHFDTVLPGRVHRVNYEALVDDTEAEVHKLLDYCGLPFDSACLRFYETDRAVRTASSEQVRRPINKVGIDHWRNYEPWLDPLKRSLGPILDTYPDVPLVFGNKNADRV